MAGAVAPKTEDWLLPEGARPPTIGELEARIELALTTARASEAAIMTVGAAAFDAAEQAKRAAELAERASLAVHGARAEPPPPAVARNGSRPKSTPGPFQAPGLGPTPGPVPAPERKPGERGLDDFSQRADRLAARLQHLQQVPLGVPIASGAATP